MKKITLVVLSIIIVSCKGETKKEVKDAALIEDKQIENTVKYPKLENVDSQLNYIFDNGFEFTDDIKVDYIALQAKGGDSYQLIYGLDSESNLERIETLKISAVFYADNPKLFKDKLYQDRKSRQIPAVCKIMMLDDEPVVFQEFILIPKKHKQVKFYFYSKSGVENEKMLTVRNINMPK